LTVLFILLASAPRLASGAEPAEPAIAAVLSSEAGPYREALAGLQEELGFSVPVFSLSRGEPKIPDSARIVVAFGSKAALLRRQDRLTLVYAMSPGVVIKDKNTFEVHMEPEASVLLSSLKKIQPGLKKLGILWQSPKFEAYLLQLRSAAAELDMSIEDSRLEKTAEVPGRLRILYGKIDAIWLPPDPLLLNADNLTIFTEFSRSNNIPFFVPSGGLLEQGLASVTPTFREIGRLAAIAARSALTGQNQKKIIYPTRVELGINKAAAAKIGLKISEETLRQADKIIP